MRLVPNAGKAWRWFSVQSMVLSIAIIGGWGAMPPDLKDRVPETVVDYVAVGVLILGIAGRLVKQGGNDA